MIPPPTLSGRFLDLDTWSRRSTFEFFRPYALPFFNVCTDVDVTPLVDWCGDTSTSFFAASWFVCLQAANAVEPLRYRLRGDRVWVHDRLHIGTTVLRPDESFGFCYFEHADDLATFADGVEAELAAFCAGASILGDRADRDDVVHGSVLPWVSFTSVSHARRLPAADSVPKITFGRYTRRDGAIRMPVSIELHHALADGLHAARFLEQLEARCADPDGNSSSLGPRS